MMDDGQFTVLVVALLIIALALALILATGCTNTPKPEYVGTHVIERTPPYSTQPVVWPEGERGL